jgi:hypothetical protein
LTIFVLHSKLGVQIKTTVSANLLGEALNGTVTTLPLMVGQVVSRKVEKQSAHFYSVTLTEEEAQDGLICKVHSSAKNKFKVHFPKLLPCVLKNLVAVFPVLYFTSDSFCFPVALL